MDRVSIAFLSRKSALRTSITSSDVHRRRWPRDPSNVLEMHAAHARIARVLQVI
jgi:hypothetical protein